MNFRSGQTVFSIDVRCHMIRIDRLIKRWPSRSAQIFVFRTEIELNDDNLEAEIAKLPEQSLITNDARVNSFSFVCIKVTCKRLNKNN